MVNHQLVIGFDLKTNGGLLIWISRYQHWLCHVLLLGLVDEEFQDANLAKTPFLFGWSFAGVPLQYLVASHLCGGIMSPSWFLIDESWAAIFPQLRSPRHGSPAGRWATGAAKRGSVPKSYPRSHRPMNNARCTKPLRTMPCSTTRKHSKAISAESLFNNRGWRPWKMYRFRPKPCKTSRGDGGSSDSISSCHFSSLFFIGTIAANHY